MVLLELLECLFWRLLLAILGLDQTWRFSAVNFNRSHFCEDILNLAYKVCVIVIQSPCSEMIVIAMDALPGLPWVPEEGGLADQVHPGAAFSSRSS